MLKPESTNTLVSRACIDMFNNLFNPINVRMDFAVFVFWRRTTTGLVVLDYDEDEHSILD